MVRGDNNMTRIIIGGFLVGFPLLVFIFGWFLGFSVSMGGPGIVFWVGVILIIWGYKSRKKAEKEGGELNG